MKTDIVEISGTDRVIIIHTDELSFTPALTLTDAEYQAAERVAFAAEAMGEHVLIKGRADLHDMRLAVDMAETLLRAERALDRISTICASAKEDYLSDEVPNLADQILGEIPTVARETK